MPVYLYLNPDIIGYLLSPLLDAQSSPQYTFNYAAIDLGIWYSQIILQYLTFKKNSLGGPFPSATGNLQGNNERVERKQSYKSSGSHIDSIFPLRICKYDYSKLSPRTSIRKWGTHKSICKNVEFIVLWNKRRDSSLSMTSYPNGEII